MSVTDIAGWVGLARDSHDGKERLKEEREERSKLEAGTKLRRELATNLIHYDAPELFVVKGFEETNMFEEQAKTWQEADLVGKFLLYAKLRLVIRYHWSAHSPVLPPGQNLTRGGVVVARGRGCGVILGSPWCWRADQLDVIDNIPGGLETA